MHTHTHTHTHHLSVHAHIHGRTQTNTQCSHVQGNPLIINFKVPKGWKVSTNTGIAVQNYVTAESAYVLVAPAEVESIDDVAAIDPKYVLDKVFDIRGRYGTFGKIDTISVKKTKVDTEGTSTYKYIDFAFSSLTPGGRDVERNGCIKVILCVWVRGCVGAWVRVVV